MVGLDLGRLCLCPIGPDDVNKIIPSQQADFGNIRPMAVGFPKRIFAIGTAWCSRFVPLGELLFHAWVCPNGFAFVAEDCSGESTAMLADAYAAQTVSAHGTFFYVDKEWFRHRNSGLKLWVQELSFRKTVRGLKEWSYWIGNAVIRLRSRKTIRIRLSLGFLRRAPSVPPRYPIGLSKGASRMVAPSSSRLLVPLACPFARL